MKGIKIPKIKFTKYQGTGNDFIMVDQRRKTQYKIFRLDTELIANMCDRRFGIGADGLILLQNKAGYDFEMVYFNADGRESSMCGNGGRCIGAFAAELMKMEKAHFRFWAIDGEHEVVVTASTNNKWMVVLKMSDVVRIETNTDFSVLNTGSPHYVQYVDRLNGLDVKKVGRDIRYSDRYKAEGINVNFVERKTDGSIAIRTYERGVEDETLSCGTGATACAIADWVLNDKQINALPDQVHKVVKVVSDTLFVDFVPTALGGFESVYLSGPACKVFTGEFPVFGQKK